ncbi:MAG: XcyI family restriction endonuclease [Clostridiales bacterium]|jgi:hypothetical protein|nr:XcyI family restriction endonuclease [Clostridiales bacterium]
MMHLPTPNLQIDFAYCLKEVREKMLADALQSCVEDLDLSELDSQLHEYADAACLRRLASFGLRGELAFAVPCVLEKDPVLLGYYRLLLGYSQKLFYTAASGAGQFKSMEEKGALSRTQRERISDLCHALCKSAATLVDGLADYMLNRNFLDELTLLTLGPQLRGGANVQRGAVAIRQVFDSIQEIVKDTIQCSSSHHIEIKNASGRKVLIEFASDPDIVIREELRADMFRNLIAIEVKGGQDYSNIHNRIGEAEKSHQKARNSGYIECWTVVNVDRMDIETAKKESPSTNMFFRISDLLNAASAEHQTFSDLLVSCVGIQ